ncbi:unnamed protein product [Spodoptera exigua]|uniref:Mab-21-like HhH/H2TH-like domain-containing protein n=1 Tax=Spodoptera exigua TaxID=7107 RepID=A0A922M6J6_SPOEX|nr:hypothetical protein HF086_004003 [Spodoptera exigua]CAH0701839.1 unnamed protein product [Spodoptera exigua]
MGNCKSKKEKPKEPATFFEYEKKREAVLDEQKKLMLKNSHRRFGEQKQPLPPQAQAAPPSVASPVHAPAPHVRSYDEEALDRMREDLRHRSDRFLLNNILLSIQFFENYEREMHQIKNNPISEREHMINEAMVRQNKHVFFADRLQECVHEHVIYKGKDKQQPLLAPRLFVIHDNVEASEPGDTSDYSAVLDAPFYKLQIEDGVDPGYIKLKKIEVLESTLHKENEVINISKAESDDSIYTDSAKESNASDEFPYSSRKDEESFQKVRPGMDIKMMPSSIEPKMSHIQNNGGGGRRYSGPIKQYSLQVAKSDISNMRHRNIEDCVPEEDDTYESNTNFEMDNYFPMLSKTTSLMSERRLSGPTMYRKKRPKSEMRSAVSEGNLTDNTETSGYRSNSSSRQVELSENESDYGYATITEAATPRKIELSLRSNYSLTSGALPEEAWTTVDVKVLGEETEEDDNDDDEKALDPANLFESVYYLNSLRFMKIFVDNFIMNLGSGLGLTSSEIHSALTQGACIYCDTTRNGTRFGYEIFPALFAAWPNAANPWIIRERKVIRNPRNNNLYQWPNQNMVSKAIGFGCLLVPIGFRIKRGLNPNQPLQWKLIFPAVERYLESYLAHAQIRCYLFALALHKTFIENETAKIGLDASHIKNHLFWRCEDNYARWPEDQLGTVLLEFLESLYGNLSKSRMPNYFIDNCNEIKNIPHPLLREQQSRLAKIIEAPVLHMLSALNKIKYTKRDFYPKFQSRRLFQILTCKDPLRLINPNIPKVVTPSKYEDSSESETESGFWETNKAYDRDYRWRKAAHRKTEEKKKSKTTTKQQKEAWKQYTIPLKMDQIRRRLVLEFFIPHFIAMARSSEKFEAIRQALIYLEQAQRLSILLSEETGGDFTAKEYLKIIKEKLIDCQRKLVQQSFLPQRSDINRKRKPQPRHKQRPKFEDIQDSPVESPGIPAFTFVDVHTENSMRDHMKLNEFVNGEESKL